MRIDPNKTFAIIVGVEHYDDDELHALPAAASNAGDFRKLLINRIGIPASNIYLNMNPDSSSDLLDEIEEWIDENKYKWDLILFYYAGHGVKSDDQSSYYLSTKTIKPQRPATRGIDIHDLITKHLNTSRLLMILDCCFSGMAFNNISSKYDYYIMASSSSRETSKYPLNEDNSAFTGTLMNVLEKGINEQKAELTIEDVFQATKKILEDKKLPVPLRLSKGELDGFAITRNNSFGENAGETTEQGNDNSDADILYKGIRKYDDTIIEEKQSLNGNSPSFNSQLHKLILQRYPYPLAYYLKSLFANHEETSHVDFYARFYEQAIKLMVYILIDDLVDNKEGYDVTKLGDFDLNNVIPENCLQILKAGCEKFSGRLFISEFTANAAFLTSASNLQKAIKDNAAIPQVRKAAIRFLADLGFFSRYPMIAIRSILVDKGYRPPNRYRHEVSVLMGETLDIYRRNLVFEEAFLNNGTILLFKKRFGNIVKEDKCLNLWPLVVDANGFKDKSEKPDVYLFSSMDEEALYEFKYEMISLKRRPDDSRDYGDINDSITEQEKKKYFDVFMKNLQDYLES